MNDYYSIAGCNQEWVMMARAQYLIKKAIYLIYKDFFLVLKVQNNFKYDLILSKQKQMN